MKDIFQKQENYYSLRNPKSLVSKRKFTATYEIDTIFLKGPQIWQDSSMQIGDIEKFCPLDHIL